jgi:hypothetical protein
MKIFEGDGIYFYKVHVDWSDASNTTVSTPQKIAVAPYHTRANSRTDYRILWSVKCYAEDRHFPV